MLSSGIWSPASPPLSASSVAIPLSLSSADVRDWTCHPQREHSAGEQKCSEFEAVAADAKLLDTPDKPEKLMLGLC